MLMYGLLTVQLFREAAINGKLGITVNALTQEDVPTVRRVHLPFHLASAYFFLTVAIHRLSSMVLPNVSSQAYSASCNTSPVNIDLRISFASSEAVNRISVNRFFILYDPPRAQYRNCFLFTVFIAQEVISTALHHRPAPI